MTCPFFSHIICGKTGDFKEAFQQFNKRSITISIAIGAIVLILSITLAPLNAGILVMFLFGIILLIGGMSLFTRGSGMSMELLADSIGVRLGKTKKIILAVIIFLFWAW